MHRTAGLQGDQQFLSLSKLNLPYWWLSRCVRQRIGVNRLRCLCSICPKPAHVCDEQCSKTARIRCFSASVGTYNVSTLQKGGDSQLEKEAILTRLERV